MNFDLDSQRRDLLYRHVIEKIEDYYTNTQDYSTSPNLEIKEIRSFIDQSDFQTFDSFKQAIDHVINGLEEFSVHTPHPKYFGLFNPRASFPGILADLITAAFNPQLAAWSHAPFANEVETRLIQEFGQKFGYEADAVDGVFASGGAEANLTAVLCALNHSFPDYAKNGLLGLSKRPVIYCSEEAHHSIDKAAQAVGLGYSSVQSVPMDNELKMDAEKVRSLIQQDITSGKQPFMLIGTAGTTGYGAIDNLPALRKIADEFNLWYHVDAAYGGGAILHNDLKSYLKGIEESDSITFDAHKWMSVPMGTSLFLASHKEILGKTFRIKTEYMPKEACELDVVDPFAHSIQWSRRFMGLKVYLSLLFFGWDGFAEVIGHQTRVGDLLREKLIENEWTIKNNTPLPVICFTEDSLQEDAIFIKTVVQNIIDSGKSWISVYPVNQTPTLRVCITNYNTSEQEIDDFITEINYQRECYKKTAP